MNKLFPVTLTLLMSISSIVTPSIARTYRPNCNSTLQSVKNSLTGVRSFEQNNLGSRGQPRGRSQSLDITFKADAKLFPSDERQMAIASRIIKSCSKIASVTFAFYQSDGFTTYGIKNSQIIEFTCVEAGRPKKPKWGENYCP
jgi:hypothetical protein